MPIEKLHCTGSQSIVWLGKPRDTVGMKFQARSSIDSFGNGWVETPVGGTSLRSQTSDLRGSVYTSTRSDSRQKIFLADLSRYQGMTRTGVDDETCAEPAYWSALPFTFNYLTYLRYLILGY